MDPETAMIYAAIMACATIVAACVSAIAIWWSARLSSKALTNSKNIDYKNTYYALVLQKRMDAYELIEQVISEFSYAVGENGQQSYYPSISTKDDITKCIMLLVKIKLHTLWISNDMNTSLTKLNYMLYKLRESADIYNNKQLIELGKKLYDDFGKIRVDIGNQLTKDMLSLHEIEEFLATKKDQRLERIPVDLSAYKL
ncbi:hypothetical protein [Megasphaera sueciensis]|jgi:hypothetical protein|uniref:hypothetical protein n=1 Tax=Megasphaera sueciensis TaxID=349094 RepID=UPI003D038D52